MSKSNNKAWNTKYGKRRVREEAPTLEEAIAAAQGLADEPGAQAEIAAALFGLPLEQVQAAMRKLAPPRKDIVRSYAFTGPDSAPRAVVVERKPARRMPAAPDRKNWPARGGIRGATFVSAR